MNTQIDILDQQLIMSITADTIKAEIKGMVKRCAQTINDNKNYISNPDSLAHEKIHVMDNLNRCQYQFDHIKDGKYIIDLIDIEGIYYIFNKAIEWIFCDNALNQIPGMRSIGGNEIILCMNGSIKRYQQAYGFQQYIIAKACGKLDELYSAQLRNGGPSELCRISNIANLFEFNIIPFQNDFLTLQKSISAISQEFQTKLDAMAQEMKMVSKVATDRIRDLEMEVHYLKSISENKVKVDYESIKQKNKALNAEFKRIYKLYRR